MVVTLTVTAFFLFFTGGTAISLECVTRARQSAIDWTFINEQYDSMFGWNGFFNTEDIIPDTRNKTVTLIFGDSIDRMIISDLCDRVNGTIQGWGDDIFKYKPGQHASGACSFGRGVIAFLHVFGSPLQGPYLHGHKNSADDPYTDTLPRVIKGLDVFTRLYGVPNVVFYRAELWDAHVTLNSNVSEHRGIIQHFVNDTTTTFLALRTHLPRTTLLATHTIPITNWGGIIHLRYSSALRYIAKKNGILLIDWQHLVSDASLQNYLRDEHHPTPALCASLGLFIVRIANKYQYEIEACDN